MQFAFGSFLRQMLTIILSSIGFSQYSLQYQILAFLFMGNYHELVTSAFWPQNSFWKAAGSQKSLGLILSKFHKLSKTQFICQGNGDNEVDSIDTVMINLGQMPPPSLPATIPGNEISAYIKSKVPFPHPCLFFCSHWSSLCGLWGTLCLSLS